MGELGTGCLKTRLNGKYKCRFFLVFNYSSLMKSIYSYLKSSAIVHKLF